MRGHALGAALALISGSIAESMSSLKTGRNAAPAKAIKSRRRVSSGGQWQIDAAEQKRARKAVILHREFAKYASKAGAQ